MYPIGEETSEQLDYRPASLVRVQIARIKYACACEQAGVVVPSRSDGHPAPVIDKGLAAPGLLAYVVVTKYADHLPLDRLEERFRDDKDRLDELVRTVKSTPRLQHSVIIEGYSDDSAVDSDDVQLSRRRAQAVANYLARRGVAPGTMTTTGLGSQGRTRNEGDAHGPVSGRVVISVETFVE